MHKNSSRILLHLTAEDFFETDRQVNLRHCLYSVQSTRIIALQLADVLLTVVGLAHATENYGMPLSVPFNLR